MEQLRAELAARGGSVALASTPTAPSPVGADTGSPQAGGLNGSVEVRHFRGSPHCLGPWSRPLLDVLVTSW